VVSGRLATEHEDEAEAFPLVRAYVVGATGFEPVTSSVSEIQGTAVLTVVLAGHARP
jgi:hypothetical protein